MSDEVAKSGGIFNRICTKCGVEFNIRRTTIEKRKATGNADHIGLCRDCRPYTLRKGKMTGYEVWEAYKKEMGIK